MSAEEKIKAATIAVGTALATAGAWLGIRSHEDKKEQDEQARLQAEYVASRAHTQASLDEQHREVRNTIQELGQFNPQGNFANRFRRVEALRGSQSNQEPKQPVIQQPDLT